MQKLTLLLLLVLLASCAPSLDKALKVATKTQANATAAQEAIHQAWPLVPATFAAKTYPAKTKYVPGKTIVKVDTVFQKGPVLNCPPVTNQAGQTVTGQVKCPDTKVLYQTITRTDTLYLPDGAALEVARLQADSMGAKLIREKMQRQEEVKKAAGYKEARNKAYWFSGIVLLLLAGMFYWFVIRRCRTGW